MTGVVQPEGAITSVPTGAITDQVLSPDGQTLYVARDGTINAYSVSTGSLINSWSIGTELGGIDMSPDGSFLVATELQGGSGTTFPVYRLDLSTGVSTTYQVPHPSGSLSAGFGDVAILSDGSVLLSGTNQWEALTTYNFSTGAHTFSTETYYPSTFTTSADHTHVLMSSDGISDARLYMYTAGSGVTAAHEWYADGIDGYNSGIQAISADGSLVAEGVDLAIYDADLHLVTTLADRYPFAVAGLAFSPDGSKLYVLDSHSNDVFVLSTTTWDVLGGYSVGQTVSENSWQGAPASSYGDALLVSADGSLLVADTAVFVQVIDMTKAISETGTSGDDQVTGTGAADWLYGFEGNDTLDGKGGADQLYGGTGDDTYIVDDPNDAVIERSNQGYDTIYSSAADYWMPVNVEKLVLTDQAVGGHGDPSANTIVGNDLDNTLTGNAGDDTLIGNGGNDVLDGGAGNDHLQGGVGDDTYYVDSPADLVAENADEGTDTVVASISYTLAANVENLTLTGVNSSGHGNLLANTIVGNATDNALYGDAGNDTLSGAAGDDTLVGGAGDDSLDGGAGNDTASYVGATAGVRVDLRVATAQNTLGAGVDTFASIENVTGTTYGDQLSGNDVANNLVGLAGDDRLTGYGGNDTLDGGVGNDRMIGGTGDDLYRADSYSDVVVENAGEGNDTVISTANFKLHANIENLTLSGTASIWGYGNELDNVLTGNSGINKLFGLAGNDTLDGKSGADRMWGGTGDDRYYVDNYGDHVVENAGEGTDTVFTSANYKLGANVENLTITGFANLWGYGNDIDNSLTGNAGANKLYGMGGSDTLNGGGGNDWLEGGAGADKLSGGTGADSFVFRDGDFGGATVASADEITDFTHGEDHIRLNYADANALLSGDQAFAFIGAADFDGHAGELRYEQVSGDTFVSGDTNGDGIADFMIRIDGLHTLTTSDFAL